MLDLESIGGGAGAGGIMATVLALLGIGRKQDKKVCDAIHKSIDDKFQTIVEVQKEIRSELRDLNNNLMRKVSRPD